MRQKNKLLIALGVTAAAAAAGCLAFILLFDVPSWQRLDPAKLHGLAQTSSIYDADGALLSEIRGTENRRPVEIGDIPLHTQQAFLAAEDLRFYTHRGIDFYRILGALRSNLRSHSLAEGASTITQQLAKLTHLSPEKTIRRKLEEVSLALQIEAVYSKDEILEMYLNTVYFGRGAYGIQAAAIAYFGTDVSALSIAQSACLAAIIKAPSVYAPHLSPESNAERRQYILNTMLENGLIDQTQFESATAEKIWVIAEQEYTAGMWMKCCTNASSFCPSAQMR